MTGLVVDFKPASQIAKEEKEAALKKEESSIQESLESALAARIRRTWETNRWAKQKVYRRLLGCLRARKGEYSDAEKTAMASMGGADPIYLKLTGTKSRAAAAWIRDILLPLQDRPWEIQPTPIPELPDDIKEATMKNIITQMQQMAQQDGMQLDAAQQMQFTDMVKSKVLDQLSTVAHIAIKNIELKIEDMMIDGEFKKALEEFIEDFVTYPFAVLKGPYYQTKTYLKWVGGKPTPTQENVLCWRRVSPFDVYYSPHAQNIQSGDFIERIRYSREQLYMLKGMEGFMDHEIDAVLSHHANVGLQDWIWEDFQRDVLEKNSTFFLSDKDTIDALHFWGHVKGEDLVNWGYDKSKVNDLMKMYPVDAILIGRNVIRCVINDNPMGWRPYHSACWDAIPASLVGVALCEQMEDHQKMVNATARALATNMSIGAGPQVSILADMIAPGEDITSIYPLKIWQMRSSITGNSGKPIEFFQPEIKSAELLAVLNQFEQKADDVTNVPRYSYGNEKIGGAGSTATGLSMLMNSAAKGIRRAIANIDLNVIQPTVYQTFVEVMMKDPDPAIRGDVKVIASGSAAVLIKEQTQENQKEFLQITTNPFDIDIMGKKGRAKLLANIADSLHIDPLVLPTPEELQQREDQERQMQMQQQQAEIQAAQQQGQPQGAGEVPADQVAALEVQQKAMEQQAAQVDLKDKMVQKQAGDVQSEIKRLKAMQKQVEDQMAALAAQKTQQDFENKKALMEVEKARINQKTQIDMQTQEALNEIKKAKMDLELEADKLKNLTARTKMITATKEEEVKKDGKAEEKTQATEASAKTEAAIKEAMGQVAEALKLVAAPKQINVQRDKDGKITGASAKPAGTGLKAD